MKLSRITSEFSYGDWVIHKFGIKEDGTPVHARSEFRDWFYFKADQIGQLSRFDKIDIDIEEVYKSIYGDDCYRVTYTSIKEKNKIVKAFPDYTYEADVKPEFKYLMGRKNLEWADASERNIGYFDIETFSPDDFAGPDNPHAPITSIQIYCSRQKRYYMITWHEEETEHLVVPEIVNRDDVTYIFCKDEVDVVLSFFELLKENRVDVLTGWYSKGFDMPYICQRCDRININYNEMSPVGRVTHYNKGYEWKTYIDGIDHIDMMEAVSDELNYNLPNNKLATAMKEILKDPDVEKLTEVTWRDWKDNFKGFMKYGLMDVRGLVEIDESLGIFDLFCTVQKITNITQLSDISFKSSVVDKFIISDCRDKFVFPTRRTAKKQQYMGATVLDPKPGLWEDVGLVDFASLYPTSVMSFNLSPETFICSQVECEEKGLDIENVVAELNRRGTKFIDTGYSDELVGGRYLFYSHESRLGVLPHILKEMYEERRRIKREMKKLKKGSPEHNALDKHQYALKIILNSAYGAFGFNYFRLYKVEVADAITFFARRALQFAIDGLNSHQYEVIYGDTDSCFFTLNSTNREQPAFDDEWVKDFNEDLKVSFIPEYNNGDAGEYAMMELEWEMSFDRIYFGNSKKRYYGMEKDSDEKYIKGLTIIRKDTPHFLADRLNEITEAAVTGGLTIEKLLALRKLIEEQPYDNIGVTKAYGKPFSQFKVKSGHVRGAEFANAILGTKINHKDTPFLFYIKSKCEDDIKKTDRHKTICLLPEDVHFIDDRTDLFEIDYDTYFDKQVIQQLKEFQHIEQVKDVLTEYKEILKNAVTN